MKLIKDLGRVLPNENCKQKVKFGIYECPICKIHFKTRTPDVISKKSTKCLGCHRKTSHNTTHGKSKTRIYNIWCLMIGRTENKNSTDYIDYGQRGIHVCKEWRKDFSIFEKWSLENGYEKTLKIDRKNNDGNYEPSNCRWVNQKIQSRNTRIIRVNNSSGYRGVTYRKSRDFYEARIRVDYKMIYLGGSRDPKVCAKYYNDYVINHKLEHTINIL